MDFSWCLWGPCALPGWNLSLAWDNQKSLYDPQESNSQTKTWNKTQRQSSPLTPSIPLASPGLNFSLILSNGNHWGRQKGWGKIDLPRQWHGKLLFQLPQDRVTSFVCSAISRTSLLHSICDINAYVGKMLCYAVAYLILKCFLRNMLCALLNTNIFLRNMLWKMLLLLFLLLLGFYHFYIKSIL